MGKKKKKNNSRDLVFKYLQDLDDDIDTDLGYRAVKYGEGKVSSFEIKGLVNSFAMVSEWPSREGYDISVETKLGKNLGYGTKRISLHLDELECVLRAINDLNLNNK